MSPLRTSLITTFVDELIPTPKRRHRGYVYIPKSISDQAAKQYLALALVDGKPVVTDVEVVTKNLHELSSMMTAVRPEFSVCLALLSGTYT